MSVRHQISRLDGMFGSEFTLDTAIQERAFGCLFNSSRKVHMRKCQGNVRLALELMYIDKLENGFLKIPMVAIRNIKPGEEFRWCYDHEAGAAGDLLRDCSEEDESYKSKDKESKGINNGIACVALYVIFCHSIVTTL